MSLTAFPNHGGIDGSGLKSGGFTITDDCIGCGECASICPQGCIDTSVIPYVIEQEHCLHCGACMGECPVGAVSAGNSP